MKTKCYNFYLDDMTVETAFEEFLTAKEAAGLSPATIRGYRFHFNAILKYMDGTARISELTDQKMRRAVAEMARQDLSRNSIRSYTATLASFFSWMREEGLCDVKIALFKGEETVKETYSREDLERLLKRPNRRCHFCEFRNWVIVNLLVNNGCRAATVRAIEVGDVDLDRKVIRCRHTKNRQALTLPLCQELIGVLDEYLKIRRGDPEDPLFPDLSGSAMSANCLRNAIRRYNLDRGVKLTSIHAFRHTFARIYLVECQGNALMLQRLLGHRTLDMTKRYVRIFDADLISDFQGKSPLSAIKKAPRQSAKR